jgi:hypothetical protein
MSHSCAGLSAHCDAISRQDAVTELWSNVLVEEQTNRIKI